MTSQPTVHRLDVVQELQTLQTIADALDAAKAPNTRRCYRDAWRFFVDYCKEWGESSLPAEPRTVAMYLASRAESGLSVSSVRQSCTAIGYYHSQAGQPNPCSHGTVKEILKGISRLYARPAKQAKPLTRQALAAIESTATIPRRGQRGDMETSAYAYRRGIMDIVMCFLASDGGLRRSELSRLTWDDVIKHEDGSGRIYIAKSKTDQTGEGAWVFVTSACMAYLAMYKKLCRHTRPADRVIPLTGTTISIRIKAAAKAAGLGEGFSGHSGRVGLARRMSKNGAPVNYTMLQGRWKSGDQVARYTRQEDVSIAKRYLE